MLDEAEELVNRVDGVVLELTDVVAELRALLLEAQEEGTDDGSG